MLVLFFRYALLCLFFYDFFFVYSWAGNCSSVLLEGEMQGHKNGPDLVNVGLSANKFENHCSK